MQKLLFGYLVATAICLYAMIHAAIIDDPIYFIAGAITYGIVAAGMGLSLNLFPWQQEIKDGLYALFLAVMIFIAFIPGIGAFSLWWAENKFKPRYE